MKKQFIITAEDIIGNIVWGVSPTLKETAEFVRNRGGNGTVSAFLFIGKGKVEVKSLTKMEFSDPEGQMVKLGVGFDLNNLVELK